MFDVEFRSVFGVEGEGAVGYDSSPQVWLFSSRLSFDCLALSDKEECKLGKITDSSYFRRRLGDSGVRGNEVKPTSPGLTSIEENGHW